MAKRSWILLSVGVLCAVLPLAGCTRAKPEASTPTVASGSATAAPPGSAATTLGPNATPAVTLESPPATAPLTPGPTSASAADVTPLVVPAETPALAVPTSPPPSGVAEYTVQWGDTLLSIAYSFDTTVEAIMALNGLTNAGYIRIGQVLKVSGTPGAAPGPAGQYVVQPGDTLYSIALRYGTTVDAIQQANGIVDARYVSIGQTLVIPGAQGLPVPPGSNSYVVQAGDTLYGIALRYGMDVGALIAANNLSDPYWIHVGQVLTIPY